MSQAFVFEPYEGQEGDRQIGLRYAPRTSADGSVGPNRPGTGFALYDLDTAVLTPTLVFGTRPQFNSEDCEAARLAAQDATAGI